MNRFGIDTERYLSKDKGVLRKCYTQSVGYSHIGAFIRFHYIKRLIRNMGFEKILDAGCGDGSISFYLAQKYPNAMIDSFDILEEKVVDCNNISKEVNYKNVNFFVSDIRDIKFANKYDIVFFIDVLEHIPAKDNHLAIKNLYKSLKDGGYLLIHVPVSSARIFSKELFKNTTKEINETHIDNLYDKQNIVDILESEGFKLEVVKNTFGFFGKFLWEIDKILYENAKFIYIFLLPFIKMLSFIEAHVTYKMGNGVLVLAKKES